MSQNRRVVSVVEGFSGLSSISLSRIRFTCASCPRREPASFLARIPLKPRISAIHTSTPVRRRRIGAARRKAFQPPAPVHRHDLRRVRYSARAANRQRNLQRLFFQAHRSGPQARSLRGNMALSDPQAFFIIDKPEEFQNSLQIVKRLPVPISTMFGLRTPASSPA